MNVSRDDTAHLSLVTLDPAQRTTHTIGAFVQDTIALVPRRTTLTLGVKGEHNSFSGFEFAPSVRGAWTPDAKTTVWAAVSRAVRAPVRIDQDLVFGVGNTVLLEANDDFRSETVLAYELGWRRQVSDTVTVDVATFYNLYHDLRTTEPAGAAPLPVTFKNGLKAESTGAEATVMYQPFARLFFKLGYRYLDLDFTTARGSRATASAATEANDPRHLGTLSAHADFGWNLEFDASLRYVSSRPDPATAGYTVGDLRLGWSPTDHWSVSLSERNLFAGLHRELVTTNSLNEYLRPSATLKVTWKY